jgi:hypothetical protein
MHYPRATSTPEPIMTSVSTPAPAQAKASIWEDFLDIFYEPAQVFARRMDGKFGLALLVLVVLSALLMYASMQALEPAYTGELERGMAAAAEQNPNMTAEQMEAGRGIGRIMMMVTGLIMVPIIVLLTGIALWLVGKLFDSTQTLAQGIMVATYANFPRFVLGSLLMTLQGFLLDLSSADRLYDVTFSAARFAPEGSSELSLALLSRLDLFVIWATILLGIGLHVTGKIPKGKAMMAAVIVWVIGSLPVVLGALRGS